jgi:hypothetical protein
VATSGRTGTITFQAWADDRCALDDVWQPKEQVCFKGRHNRQPAEGLDVDVVHCADKSLHHAVEALHQSASLLAALAATRPV